MKKVAISIKNGLFAEGVEISLKKSREFILAKISTKKENMLYDYISLEPDILLIDVIPTPMEITIEKSLEEIEKIKEKMPKIKVALICDEVAFPKMAKEVAEAKKEGKIEAFFYSSVTTQYLTASLNSL